MDLPKQFMMSPLFLKPLLYPGPILFSKYIASLGAAISFRSMDLDKDLESIYQWVNLPYALRYWQLDGTKQRVFDTYYDIQRNSNGHSYIGMLDDKIVCQFDLYRVLADEIHQYIPAAEETDCGFHLLMSPNEKPVHGLSTILINTMLDYYFSFPKAMRMYAEPDIENRRSNFLLRQAGFQFIQAIKMSYKTANLYCLSREQFRKLN